MIRPAWARGRRRVNLSRLRGEERRQAWAWIREHRPALADMLQNDPVVAEIRRRFDAAVILDLEETT